MKIEVELPEKIVTFLKAMQPAINMTVEEYVVYSVLGRINGELENDVFFDEDAKDLKERFGLKAILE